MTTYLANEIIQKSINNPNRISHFKVQNPYTLVEYLERYLVLNELNFEQLLELGCIYINGKRILEHEYARMLLPDDYIRVHTQPRRFKIPNQLSELIFAETDDFLIFNKPHGLPCHPTLDNRKENALFALSQLKQQELFLCHRLDMGTRGLLLFAKTKKIQTYFMENWKSVRKIYQAWTSGPTLALGLQEHWMRPHPRAPKIIASRPVEGWQLCQLEILNVKTQINDDKSLQNNILFTNKYEIELITGRTHQIRAQLSFEQNPILGDSLYGSPFYLQDTKSDQFELCCEQLIFTFNQNEYHFHLKNP